MARYLDANEAREKMDDRLRRNGVGKSEAAKLADRVVGNALDNYARKTGEKRR